MCTTASLTAESTQGLPVHVGVVSSHTTEIVLLDVLTPDARARIAHDWDAVMGRAAEAPMDEPALGGYAATPDPLAHVAESARWLVLLLAAAIYATLAVALLPSREAFAAILLGFGVAAAYLVRNRRPAS